MRFKRSALALFVALMALVLTNAAVAKSVTLTYEFQNQAYYVSVNGSTHFTPMMCDSFDNNIYRGETWTATKSPFLAGLALLVADPPIRKHSDHPADDYHLQVRDAAAEFLGQDRPGGPSHPPSPDAVAGLEHWRASLESPRRLM